MSSRRREPDDDGMAPSSFVVQLDWAAPDAATPIPGGRRTDMRKGSPAAATAAGRQARLAFLAESSRCLADSLDYETTVATVKRLALPQVGTWCIIDVVEPRWPCGTQGVRVTASR
jgi:hypothetical protein